MFSLKYSNKRHQLKLRLWIMVILVVCFLFLTFYAASQLSSVSSVSLFPINKGPVYVRSNFVDVLITTDKEGIVGAVALMNSILINTNRPVQFYFVTSPDAVAELHSWIELLSYSHMSYIIKAFDPNKFGFNETNLDLVGDENLLDYSKFYLPQLFPQMSDILISLSNDVIVQGDIADLRNTSILRNTYGALSNNCDILAKLVYKYKSRYFHYLNMNNSRIKEMHLAGDSCTFDLSVMVLNMTLWRWENVTEQLEHWFLLNQKEKIFSKRSVLSPFLIAFNNRTSSLDNSWHVRHLGVSTGMHHSRDYLENAYLLQWNGHFKPWRHKSAISRLWARYAIEKPKFPSEDST